MSNLGQIERAMTDAPSAGRRPFGVSEYEAPEILPGWFSVAIDQALELYAGLQSSRAHDLARFLVGGRNLAMCPDWYTADEESVIRCDNTIKLLRQITVRLEERAVSLRNQVIAREEAARRNG